MLTSKRLLETAHRVLENAPVADIGTDHALLPCYLVANDFVPTAVAVEVNEGPYRMARRHVKKYGLGGRISVRHGDGLTVVKPGEVATVVVAGMGGALIADILSRGKDVLKQTKRLVLQPNSVAQKVRRWMMDEGWQLTDEELVFENGHFYDILVAEPGKPTLPYVDAHSDAPLSFLLEIGPLLWRRRHPLLLQKCEREIEKWERILDQIPEGSERRSEVENRIQNWKELILCLPRANTSSASSNSSSRHI
ncbi:MAG: tRNA (adenine(22)-N(1))-methyltransferase TrmK [Novibacillus thermophilus]